MKASILTLLILATAILIVGCAESFARGGGHGHGRGMSRDGFPLLHEVPNTSFGFAPAPPKGGGHEGATPFAIPSYGSPNVANFPGRLP